MTILSALGINESVWMMFGLFVVAYVVISRLIFIPYMKAFNQRHEKTVGSQEQTTQILAESQKLQQEYAKRAQELNEQYRSLFDKVRGEAQNTYDQIVGQARKEADAYLESSRVNLLDEVKRSKEQIPRLVPELQGQIVGKMLGREAQ